MIKRVTPARILVVEDEYLIRMLLEDMLTDLGHTVAAAVGTIAEAKELAVTGDFDCAVLDVNLGIRWEYQTPWTERYNHLAYFDRSAVDPITGRNGVLVFNNSGQPRLTKFYTQLVRHSSPSHGTNASRTPASSTAPPRAAHCQPASEAARPVVALRAMLAAHRARAM